MIQENLKDRTKRFAISVFRFTGNIPDKPIFWTITKQLVRSSTSVAANYRAVCRAKSDKDFISKMETVIEEADETLFWLELIEELNLLDQNIEHPLTTLKQECNELISIFVTSVKTLKYRIRKI